MAELFQIFSSVPNGHKALFKARIVAKNGELSAWTPWQWVTAGDTTAPTVPTGAEVDCNSPIGAIRCRLTDAYIASMDADIIRFRWYVQSRTNSGALSFDSAWTPTAVKDRDDYDFTFNIAYAADTYYHIWVIPEDVLGNWDTTPGAAQEQNKQPGSVTTSDVPISSSGWNFSGTFSATDSDTVAWSSGTLVLSDGNTYTITGSNTGNMSAVTYIYWDAGVSTTAFLPTTTAATAVGNTKILVAVAKNESGKNATFHAFGANGVGVLVAADNIVVTNLAAISADMGAITAGTITVDSSGYIRGGQTAYNTGTGFFLGYSGAAYKFSIGDASNNKLTWDGSSFTYSGEEFKSVATNNYYRVYQSDGLSLVEVSTPAGGSDTTIWGITTDYNSDADRSYGYMHIYRVVHSTGALKGSVEINAYDSDGATQDPAITLYTDDSTQYDAQIRLMTSDGDLEIRCDQDIDLKPTGSLSIGGVPGHSGTFTNGDGDTVTVTKGLITSIA